MTEQHRVLLITAHPVQYSAPLFREMARHPKLEIQVAYCSLQGAEAGFDREFGISVKWDVPLLEGYPWVKVPNRSPWPGAGFLGLVNPGLWALVMSGEFDAVVIYTGYAYLSFWIVLIAAKISGRPIIFGTDASSLAARDGKSWKEKVKHWVWPRLFNLASIVIVSSSRAVGMMRSIGIPDRQIVLTPSSVDNEWWMNRAEAVDRSSVRETWGIPKDASVVLFCGKLIPWKRPQDLLEAFALAAVPNAHLVFAGDGALRTELEQRTKELKLDGRTHFLGFMNQSKLPAVYRASDLFVLTSENEPFGNVVNEAMLCGCAALVSDRSGACDDLIWSGRNGYAFSCGNVDELASRLRELLADQDRLRRMGDVGRERMATWSLKENVEGILQAVELSFQTKNH